MEKEDYPKTFEEFIDKFQTEEDCIKYIIELRWPKGFVCPKCKSSNAWKTSRNLMHCANCRHQTSITAGTLFHNTRKPLRLWFYVMWFVMSQKTGASAKNLKEMMGFGSYETAWTWLHKFRRMMIRPSRDRLQGVVEIDETYIGGEEEGSKGRKIGKKALIVIAIEVNEKKLGRVRFRCIPDASANSLVPFVQDYIEPGSIVITDGWPGYTSLEKKGFTHSVQNITKNEKTASELMPHVHLVVSLVKRWLFGTHQGAIRSDHLSYYLDEYAFRFNRRKSKYRGKLFYRLMQQAVITEATPLKEILSTN
ncbi:MAG: IS1595 family transposase [Deltaproteobacteria bacterium]|nr:IS1595 family transposase [Deltaproteobacteria bacterium]